MKNYITIPKLALLGLCIGILAGCSYDRELEAAAAPIIPAVNGLEVELEGDTAKVSWENPAYDTPLSARVTYSGGVSQLEAPVTSFEHGIIDVNQEYFFTVKLMDAEGNYSPGQTVDLYREGPEAVSGFRGEQEGTNVNLNWTLPEEEIAGVRLTVDSQEIELPADATSYTFENSEYNSFQFKVNVLDAEGNTSPSRYLNFTVGATKIAYLGTAPDVASISDDDQVASAAFVFENYPDAEYLTFSEIKEGRDLSEFRVLYWHYDKDDNDASLPEEALDAEVVAAIEAFHKEGGALLLNIHAVEYLWTIGRMTENFGVAIGAGEGFDNPDMWGVNVNIGRAHDKSSHPLYEGLEAQNVDGRKIIPLIAPGWKEDHNYVLVDLPAYYGYANNEEAAYTAISEQNQVNILGTWDGIVDYFMMGIFETLPNEEFKGTAIAIGLGSFEWNQNNNENQYRENIEQITLNALEYLKVQ